MQPQHVLEVLSLQWELRETAEKLTDDVNEGRYLVHKVMARALKAPARGAAAMRNDLQTLLEEARGAH